ncbi:MAG TPA: alpha/beta fold hydrolase [Solirubrobacteraceae bacterium]|nr:alpha/beta fold hydrolase [Solirubrobacteraceae bacterium]
MLGKLPHAEGLEKVERAFQTLSERYLGAEPGFDATYRISLGDVGHTWEVRCTERAARVCKGATRRRPNVIISTDSETWLRLREGELSGIEAFRHRLLSARGNLDQAIAFEGLFRLPNGRPPLLEISEVPVGKHRISTLTMGHGEPVLLIHGLGGTRASMFDTASALSEHYKVYAVDLPGFGSSSKPAIGGYNAGWFAAILIGLMDELQLSSAHVVGNSMGGRIAIEMGLMAPERVSALGLLCPAVAWIKRGFHPIVRLLRPEFGRLPHAFTRGMVSSQFWGVFHDPDCLDPAVGEVIIDEFRRIYASAGARYAFLASARNIYLEKPIGQGGFYPRLAELEPPALFVWGSHDPLIPPAFGRHVKKWLPSARQVTLPSCGHLPQVEHPDETNELLVSFFAEAERERERSPRSRLRAA